MTLHSQLKRAERIVADNSPAIMTGIGVVGTMTTAYLTGKATFRAAEYINEEQDRRLKIEPGERRTQDPLLTTREKFDMTWKLYIPAISVAAISCAAIITANRVSTRRATAVATAYALSERAYDEYRAKVIEKIGDNKEREVRDEVAKARIERAGPSGVVIADGSGLVLCHDAFSNQFFKSDMETIRAAQNSVNAQILHSDYATVDDFYNYIDAEDLEHNSISGDMGWNTDKLLEIEFTTILYKERIPCLSINFAVVPIREPWRFC